MTVFLPIELWVITARFAHPTVSQKTTTAECAVSTGHPGDSHPTRYSGYQPLIAERGGQLMNRREMKAQARHQLRRQYWMIVVICLFAAFF